MSHRRKAPRALPEPAADFADAFSVLAVRLPMMAMTPTAASAREMERMFAEKAAAAVEGSVAVQFYWARMTMQMWTKGPTPELVSGAIDAFTAPGRRTLRANAKRLGTKG